MALSNTKVTGSITGSIPIEAIHLSWTWWSLWVPSNSEYLLKSVKTLFKTKMQNPQSQQWVCTRTAHSVSGSSMSDSRAMITKHVSPNNPDLQTKDCSPVQPYGESIYVTTRGEQKGHLPDYPWVYCCSFRIHWLKKRKWKRTLTLCFAQLTQKNWSSSSATFRIPLSINFQSLNFTAQGKRSVFQRYSTKLPFS